jgi:hypothetical protein
MNASALRLDHCCMLDLSITPTIFHHVASSQRDIAIVATQ